MTTFGGALHQRAPNPYDHLLDLESRMTLTGRVLISCVAVALLTACGSSTSPSRLPSQRHASDSTTLTGTARSASVRITGGAPIAITEYCRLANKAVAAAWPNHVLLVKDDVGDDPRLKGPTGACPFADTSRVFLLTAHVFAGQSTTGQADADK
jgi:hypothetical protein